MRDELRAMAAKYGDARRSQIVKEYVEIELNEADYLVREDVFAIVTADSWIKRIRRTNELGSTRIREGDRISQAHELNTHDSVLFFTNLGYLYILRVTDFPSSSGYGNPIQKQLKFRDGEQIVASVALPAERPAGEPGYVTAAEGDVFVLVSERGLGFALTLEGLDGIKRNGKRAMKLRTDDALAAICKLDKQVAFFTRKASGLCIAGSGIPVRNQAAVGVQLMGVRADDALTACVSFRGSVKLELRCDGDKLKEIESKEITQGRRGLKGTKVLPRNEVLGVRKV